MDDELKTRIINTLDWMTRDTKHRHDETGIEGNYSPELLEAIEVLELLRGAIC